MYPVSDDTFRFNAVRRYSLEDENYHTIAREIDRTMGRRSGAVVRPNNRLFTTLLSRTILNGVSKASDTLSKIPPRKLLYRLNENLPPTKTESIEVPIGRIGILGAGVNLYLGAYLESDILCQEIDVLHKTLFHMAGFSYERRPAPPHISLASFSSNPSSDAISNIAKILGDTLVLQPVEFLQHNK